jgi:hypothetical protein
MKKGQKNARRRFNGESQWLLKAATRHTNKSSHENRNKGQQENQYRATNGQNDGHQGNNGLDDVIGFRCVRMVRHDNTFERKQTGILKHPP